MSKKYIDFIVDKDRHMFLKKKDIIYVVDSKESGKVIIGLSNGIDVSVYGNAIEVINYIGENS